jgi:iron complex outermembrane receptor protein
MPRLLRVVLLLSVLLLICAYDVSAQSVRVTGRVTDEAGESIAGARVTQKGSLNSVLTDAQGRYTLLLRGDAVTLVVSAFGYAENEYTVSDAAKAAGAIVAGADVVLRIGIPIAALEVVGTRRVDRSATSSPAAVDILDVRELANASGLLDINRLLHEIAPSFNANRQSGADGSDHIDPAALRGLGPDQTLVLINGKRRHQSSLINIFGSRGRGNTGTDLNAIPMAAVERIEILRDGASAQYGSDAIAGVINIVLRSGTDVLGGTLSAGTRVASAPDDAAVTSSGTDGEEFSVALNRGWRVGESGFINATGEVLVQERTNRPADPNVFSIYRRQFGDAAARQGAVFFNSLFPVSDRSGWYLFGGVSRRHTDAYAWSRDADSERNVPAIYPNGFDPQILSNITDGSASVGMRTRAGAWDVDINNTFGLNRFHYTVDNTLNASLQASSPTEFDAGGFQLIQNTAGVRASRLLPNVRSGLNLAGGVEFRLENYEIFAGDEGSWRNYGPIYRVIDGDSVLVPGGAQGFPGFQPGNELSESRSNIGVWGDVELDITKAWLLGLAARYENYSDFGSTFNGKAATRLNVSKALALRASGSTGFRAPSLAQVYFNSTFTDFVGGVAVDKLIAGNTSELTERVGIPRLKEETATNVSVGFTLRGGGFTATVDAYQVDIDDRIVLTGAFDESDDVIGPDLQQLQVGAAQFFTNALDTQTKGLDVVLTYAHMAGNHNLRWGLASNFNDMELGAVKTTPRLAGKEDIYFGAREQAFLLASAPPSKITLSLDHAINRLDTHLRLVHYGRVTLIDWIDERDIYESRRVLDASVGYRLSDHAQLTIGAANLLNAYPSPQDTETETGGVWDAVQMGFSGTLVFVRLNFQR